MDRIAGRNQVREAMKAGRRIERVFIAIGADVSDIAQMARQRGIPVKEVDRQYLDNLVKERHQGVVAVAEAVRYWELDDILELSRSRNEPALVVALSNVEDPQNLGAVLRSADGAGAHGVVIPERRSASLTTAVGRASAGAIEYVKVAKVTNLPRAIDELKKAGLWAIGLDGSGKQTIWEVDLKGPTLLVVGGEDRGLGRLVAEKCDIIARIPMAGQVSSLNAGVAAALALYEARRQRTTP